MDLFKKNQEVELFIEDMAFGGRGFAKINGIAVFVDGAIAGDRVRARIFKKKKRYIEAELIEVLSSSEDRLKPLCTYLPWCGGCKWQALSYEKQLEYKTEQVREVLKHIGDIDDILLHKAIASPRIFHYRNKMEFSCTDKGWLLPEELQNPDIVKKNAIGLHVPGAFNRILDIDYCYLQPERANEIFAYLRKKIFDSGLPLYSLREQKGFWRYLVLRHSVSDDSYMLNIVTAKEREDFLLPFARDLAEKFPFLVSIVNNVNSGKAAIARGEREYLLHGKEAIFEKIGPFTFKISANSFFQTNTLATELLYDKIREYAALSGRERVLDLYSGTGTIAIYLSDQALEVRGIEIVESAVEDADINLRENKLSNCNFVLGDVKDILPELDFKPDLLIIDPPRAGMHPDVLKSVLKLAPPHIIYVSCNPATMARDLALMKEFYSIEEVQPVDMFPHTSHIELIANLKQR